MAGKPCRNITTDPRILSVSARALAKRLWAEAIRLVAQMVASGAPLLWAFVHALAMLEGETQGPVLVVLRHATIRNRIFALAAAFFSPFFGHLWFLGWVIGLFLRTGCSGLRKRRQVLQHLIRLAQSQNGRI